MRNQNLPAVGSVWGNPDDTATWMRVHSVDETINVSLFAGKAQRYETSDNFPPVGYVRLDDEWGDVAFQPAWPTANKPVDTEVQRNRYEAELTACAEVVQKVYLGGNSGIGLLNVAAALREIFAECAGDGLPELTDEQRAKMHARNNHGHGG